ncbi:MAG: hypothetical protein Q4G69_06520 [Planctomycetia bacterium]|nr:hypothetical protein [Planctomycetia bacterium]
MESNKISADSFPRENRFTYIFSRVFVFTVMICFLLGWKSFFSFNFYNILIMILCLIWMILMEIVSKIYMHRNGIPIPCPPETPWFKRLFRRRFRIKRWSVVLLFICLTYIFSFMYFLGSCFIIAYFFYPVPIGKNTTFITSPLTRNGQDPDYCQALRDFNEPLCSPEENGFRLLAEQIGPELFQQYEKWPDNVRKTAWKSLCQRLNLSPDIVPSVEYANPANDLRKLENSNKLPESYKKHEFFRRPWTAKEFPIMDEWLRKNKKTLDMFREAMGKKYFYFPVISNENLGSQYGRIYPNVPNSVRYTMLNALSLSLFRDLGDENRSSALSTLDLMIHCENQYVLYESGYPYSVMRYLPGVLRSHLFGETEIKSVQKSLHSLMESCNNTDRYLYNIRIRNLAEFLCTIKDIAEPYSDKKGDYYDRSFPEKVLLNCPKAMPFLLILEDINKYAEKWDEKIRSRNFSNTSQCGDLKDTENILNSISRFSFFVFKKGIIKVPFLISISIQSDTFRYEYKRCMEFLVRLEMLDIACALELYYLDHGQYPESLADLSGKYQKNIPSDKFSEKNEMYQYHRFDHEGKDHSGKSESGYFLYSVGMDGQSSDWFSVNESDPGSENNNRKENNSSNDSDRKKRFEKIRKMSDDILCPGCEFVF